MGASSCGSGFQPRAPPRIQDPTEELAPMESPTAVTIIAGNPDKGTRDGARSGLAHGA